MKRLVAILMLGALLLPLCACQQEEAWTPDVTFKGKTQEAYENASLRDLQGTLTLRQQFEASGAKVLHVEAEAYADTNMTPNVIEDAACTEGKLLSCVDKQEDGTEYRISYCINAPSSVPYRLTMLTAGSGSKVTTDFFVYLNGQKVSSLNDAVLLQKIAVPALGASAAKKTALYDFGTMDLNEGENILEFRLDNEDRNRISGLYYFYADYFDLTPVAETLVSGKLTYTDTPADYAEQIAGAEKLSVYVQNAMDLTLNMATYSADFAGDYNLVIRDYNGEETFRQTVTLGFGSYEYHLAIPRHPLGYFTLTVTRAGEEESLYSRIYTVIKAPTERIMREDSPFAVDLAITDVYAADPEAAYPFAAVAKLAGVTWIRERTRWEYLENEKGTYNYWSTDRIFPALSSAGLKICSILNQPPRWISDYLYFGSEQRAFYDLCKMLGERYSDSVHAWEIYNEQDWYGTEGQPAELYCSFMKVAIIALLDSGTPALKLMGAQCQPTSRSRHLAAYEANGLYAFTDAFNYHNHLDGYSYPVGVDFISGEVANHFSKYARDTLPDYPVWVTEAGIKMYTENGELTGAQAQRQARYLINSTVQSLSLGTDKHFWFIFRSGDSEGSGTFMSYRKDNTPLPVIPAESVLTDVLGEGSYIGKMKSLSEKAEGHILFNGTDDVAVLWSREDEEITLHTGGNVLETDMMGKQTIRVADRNGNVTLTLSLFPIYLTFDGKAPAELSESTGFAATKATVSSIQLTKAQRVVLTQLWDGTPADIARDSGYGVSAGGTRVTIRVFNLNDTPMKGTLSFTGNGYTVEGDCNVELGAYEQKDYSFTVYAGAGAAPLYFSVIGTFDGEASTPSATLIHP